MSLSVRLILILCVGAAVAISVNPAPDPAPPATDVEERFGPTAGKRVYVDPVTGKLTGQRPEGFEPGPLSPRMQNALSRSSEGLERVASPVPGGGTMVSVRGRFKCAQVAVPDGQGGIRLACGSGSELCRHVQPVK